MFKFWVTPLDKKQIKAAKAYCDKNYVEPGPTPPADLRTGKPRPVTPPGKSVCGSGAGTAADDRPAILYSQRLPPSPDDPDAPDFAEMFRRQQETFSERLLRLIGFSGRKNASVYRAANIDRRLFSKIISGRDYMPSRDTCIAFAVALDLDMVNTADLLRRAGYALSYSSKRDLLLQYAIENHFGTVDRVNELLNACHELPLGYRWYGLGGL